jgi:hypothetical protein
MAKDNGVPIAQIMYSGSGAGGSPSGVSMPVSYEWTASVIELCIYYIRDKEGLQQFIPVKKVIQWTGSYVSVPSIVYNAGTMEELVNIFANEFKTFENTRKVLAAMSPSHIDYLDKLLLLK